MVHKSCPDLSVLTAASANTAAAVTTSNPVAAAAAADDDDDVDAGDGGAEVWMIRRCFAVVPLSVCLSFCVLYVFVCEAI